VKKKNDQGRQGRAESRERNVRQNAEIKHAKEEFYIVIKTLNDTERIAVAFRVDSALN
jgi:hypothetical protein